MDAYFAGGCFWCIANSFYSMNGVEKVESGYSGGKEINPKYQDVKSQNTGHRETIHIIFNEDIISFKELLKYYFYNIDPFDSDGQFIDRGFSYTCAIFYINDSQYKEAKKYIEMIEKEYNKKVTVSLIKYTNFYLAEDYHQDYSVNHKDEFIDEMKESGRLDRKESEKVIIND